MPLTSAQLTKLAREDARKPGFTVQSGQLLQMILDDLCYKYDLEINLVQTTVTIGVLPTGTGLSPNPGGTTAQMGQAIGGTAVIGFANPINPSLPVGVNPLVGPYALPSDYLRMAQDEVVYAFSNVPQRMINRRISEIDFLGILPLTSTFPTIFATSFSTTPPSLFVWPPPTAAITLNIRYFKLQPAITSPETSLVIPWFHDQMYLRSRLTGELLKPGAAARPFLEESAVLLDQYLKSEDDTEGRAIVVKMDDSQFRFRGKGADLKPTKTLDF